MATLVGFAVQDGRLDVADVVSDILDEDWSSAPEEKKRLITVEHLLTMTSGLNILGGYVGDAGTIWNYNTAVYKKLRDVLEAVTLQDLNDYADYRLYNRIGMRESNWRATTVMEASVRDMARFGLLVLSDGYWDGFPVLTDRVYFRRMLDSSQDLNPAYGYLWWLNGKDSYLIPSEEDTPGEGPIMPDGRREDAPTEARPNPAHLPTTPTFRREPEERRGQNKRQKDRRGVVISLCDHPLGYW